MLFAPFYFVSCLLKPLCEVTESKECSRAEIRDGAGQCRCLRVVENRSFCREALGCVTSVQHRVGHVETGASLEIGCAGSVGEGWAL